MYLNENEKKSHKLEECLKESEKEEQSLKGEPLRLGSGTVTTSHCARMCAVMELVFSMLRTVLFPRLSFPL